MRESTLTQEEMPLTHMKGTKMKKVRTITIIVVDVLRTNVPSREVSYGPNQSKNQSGCLRKLQLDPSMKFFRFYSK